MTEQVDLISIVIPSYNRFSFLLNTIDSIQKQTYQNIEIIVVNDRSTQQEYYTYDWQNIKVIHLDKNTKMRFGYACAGYVRNKGCQIAEGKYIAFCDDDDIWFPNKLTLQWNAMKETGCKISSTDGYFGNGMYDVSKSYPIYNAEHYYSTLQWIFRDKGSNFLDDGFPKIWNLDFLKIHNCVICSSVLIEKEVLDKIGIMQHIQNGLEDYDCWLRALEHSNLVYISDICFYYDSGHGDGRQY